MKNTIKLALLPCVAMLTLAAVPVQAVSLSSNSSTASSLSSGSTASSTMSAKQIKKQLKREAKLRKKCAKLASGKIKSAKKRAKLTAMCRTATTQSTAGGSSSTAGDGTSFLTNPSASNPMVAVISATPPLFVPSSQPGEKTEGDAQGPLLAVSPEAQVVPEPGSLVLLGLGLLGLGMARRRRK